MQLAEAFAWCMLQVTAFTFVVACLYLAAARRQWGVSAGLLLAALCTVGLLTLLCLSPWPRWSSLDPGGTHLRTGVEASELNARHAEALSNIVWKKESPVLTEPMLERAARAKSVAAIPLGSQVAEAASPRSRRAVAWLIFAVGMAWTAAAIGLLRFLISVAALRRLRGSSVAMDNPSLLDLFDELSREVKLDRPVRLRESPTLGVAATFGWRKPIILLPTTWRQWTPDERRAVLAHELAHIHEGHFPKWLCGQLAVVAHFYHPLVHWLARRLRFEQEVAADRLAARVFGNRTRYASALATLALEAPPPAGAGASLGLFMSKPFLMRRLAMLRQSTNPTQNRARVKRVLALSLVLVAGIAAAGLRAEERQAPDESASRISNQRNDSAPAASTAGPAAITPAPATITPAPATSTLATPPAASTAVSFVEAPAPGMYATSLFRVSREPQSLLDGSSIQSDAAWEIFCKTQIALLKSYFVLQSAVRDPKIAALPMLASAEDPVGLLAQRLEVGFYPGSEILYVRMGLSRTDEAALAKQAVQIVDAIAKAYEQEVIFADRQRQLSASDLLARSYEKLKNEIRAKTEDYQEIAREAGHVESAVGQVAQQIDIRRLERIEDELMRLENNFVELQTSGKEGNVKFFEERIAQLSKRQEELEQRIIGRSEPSAELSERRRELEQLQRVADDMSAKLGLAEIEASAPNRIQRIQGAVLTSGSQPQAAPQAK
jgi:beta-lactamase regulating signal transducer with metallopeptidase domain